MSVEPERKPRYILGWEVRRAPRRAHAVPLALILLFAGLAAVVLHDIAYRQTGGGDIELGLISHAGLDMLAVTLLLSFIAAWHERWRA